MTPSQKVNPPSPCRAGCLSHSNLLVKDIVSEQTSWSKVALGESALFPLEDTSMMLCVYQDSVERSSDRDPQFETVFV